MSDSGFLTGDDRGRAGHHGAAGTHAGVHLLMSGPLASPRDRARFLGKVMDLDLTVEGKLRRGGGRHEG